MSDQNLTSSTVSSGGEIVEPGADILHGADTTQPEMHVSASSENTSSTEPQPFAEQQDVIPGGTQMDRTSQEPPAAPPTASLQNVHAGSSPLDGQGGRFYLDPETGVRKRLLTGYEIDLETGLPRKKEVIEPQDDPATKAE